MSGVLWPHIRGHIEVTRPPNPHRPDDWPLVEQFSTLIGARGSGGELGRSA
jgi:hypothetical protein